MVVQVGIHCTIFCYGSDVLTILHSLELIITCIPRWLPVALCEPVKDESWGL